MEELTEEQKNKMTEGLNIVAKEAKKIFQPLDRHQTLLVEPFLDPKDRTLVLIARYIPKPENGNSALISLKAQFNLNGIWFQVEEISNKGRLILTPTGKTSLKPDRKLLRKKKKEQA